MWKGLLKARDQLQTGFMFRFGNQRTSLWHEDWSGLGSLANVVPMIDIHDVNWVLGDLVDNGA